MLAAENVGSANLTNPEHVARTTTVHSRTGYVEIIDFLRGFACLGVAWFHLTHGDPTLLDSRVVLSGFFGWYGPTIFFVISGYIIPYSLNRSGYKLRYFGIFLIKRIVRADPPYLFTIVLLMLASYLRHLQTGLPFVMNWKRVLLHLGFLNAFFGGYPWLSPIFWTLAIEFQYYIVVGLFYSALSSKKRGYRILALLTLASTALITQSENLIPHYIFLFIMGIGLYLFKSGVVRRMEFLSIQVLSVIGALLTVDTSFALVAAAVPMVIVKVNWGNAVTRFFGNISYSFYLMHTAIAGATLRLIVPFFDSQIMRFFVLIGAMVLSIVAGWIVYILIEGPTRRLSASIKYPPNRHLT